MMVPDWIWQGLAGLVPGGLLGGLIIYLVFVNPEVLEYWWGRILKLFGFLGVSARKQSIAHDLRSKILQISKSISSQTPETPAFDLKIEWVEAVDRESFLSNNQAIIRMSESRNPHKNLVYAVQEYVSTCLMPKARLYVDAKVRRATDLTVIRKYLQGAQEHSLIFFNETILQPELQNDPELQELIQQLVRIDHNGMLFPILISEIVRASNRIFPEPATQLFVTESRDFVKFLNDIASRESGDQTSLEFLGVNFRVGIILAASNDTVMTYGITRHVKHVSIYLQHRVRTIYIFGLGDKISLAKAVTEACKKTYPQIVSTSHNSYTHIFDDMHKKNGICCRVDIGGLREVEPELPATGA